MSQQKKKVAIYGSGFLGLQVYSVLKEYFTSKFELIGFIDDSKRSNEYIVDGFQTIGSLDAASVNPSFSASEITLILAIGYNALEKKLAAFCRAKQYGYFFETLIHPNAFIEKSVTIGEGNIFLAGTVIDQHVTINDINYFDIATTIGENVVIGSANYIAAGATLGGFVKLEDSNFIGLDCTVVNHIAIGTGNFINAKTLIVNNIDNKNQVIQLHQVKCMKRL